VSDIAVSGAVAQTGVKRFGINLGGQDFYDSGQMLRNLVFINPGFEGETWQTILRCEGVSATSCTDPNQWNQWPADFLKGAQFEVLAGADEGVSGVVMSSDAADAQEKDQGVTIRFAAAGRTPQLDDFVLVRKTIPGDAQAGWWTNTWGGGSFATEFKDLAPDTPGKQALKMMADGTGQTASVSSYFDSTAGRSFVQMKGVYRLTFRAKGLEGNRALQVSLKRAETAKTEVLFAKAVGLSDGWKDYSFDFVAAEDGHDVGTVGLTFAVAGADVLLDDVSLEQVVSKAQDSTAFREEVVEALRGLRPGILRYQDGDHIGSSLDDLIAPPFARVRAGWSEGASVQGNVPLGLEEFLQLCAAVHAEPWFNMPAGMSAVEMKELIEFLAGPSKSAYGAKRAAWGQSAPWTSVFPVIHLELGNEEWNEGTFAGAAINDPVAYGERAKEIFAAARSSAFYVPKKFDLVIGTFATVPDWTRRELAASGGYDSTAVAPYLFNRMDDDSSVEAIYGPMLAEPEMVDDSAKGYMVAQAKMARSAARPAALSVYEVNLSTTSGTASQANFASAPASMGAGLALMDHMLLMLRDLGVKDQSVWSLTGYQNQFQNSATHANVRVPLFGTVVDMGGETNLRRPQFLAEELVNEAMLPTMLVTKVSGANPTWNQTKSANDDVALDGVHELQSFAFADGARRSLIVLNLSRTEALPVRFSGMGAPRGDVSVSRLEAARISDTNEREDEVKVVRGVMRGFGGGMSVPAFSMTVLEWEEQ
jgi:hypothetical protein